MRWGRKPICGGCGECRRCKKAAYMRAYYASKSPEERKRIFVEGRDPERVRQQDRARHHRMKGDPVYDQRRSAVATLNNAIRRGVITRGACEDCGAENANAHHDDYSKPLEVRWLCYGCHAREHQRLAEAA